MVGTLLNIGERGDERAGERGIDFFLLERITGRIPALSSADIRLGLVSL